MNRTVGCTHRSRNKCEAGCNWEATYEDSLEGWVLVRYARAHVKEFNADGEPTGKTLYPSNHHSGHEMMQTMAEVMSKKQGRHIPPDAVEFGRIMAASGFPTSDTDRAMRKFVADKGVAAQWERNDVREMFRSTAAEKQLDASDLIDNLQHRRNQKGLHYFWRTDADRLNMLWFELEGGFEDWGLSPKNGPDHTWLHVSTSR